VLTQSPVQLLPNGRQYDGISSSAFDSDGSDAGASSVQRRLPTFLLLARAFAPLAAHQIPA